MKKKPLMVAIMDKSVKQLDYIIIGAKEYKEYYKLVLNKLDRENKCKMSSRGKNILKMLQLSAYLVHTKEIKTKSTTFNVSKFISKESGKEIIAPELVIELIK